MVWTSYQRRKIVGCSCTGNAGNFSLPPRVSDPDVTRVPRCMLGSLTSGFLWSRWRGKRSRHSRRMRNPQFYVSGKRPIAFSGLHKTALDFRLAQAYRNSNKTFANAVCIYAWSIPRTMYTVRPLLSSVMVRYGAMLPISFRVASSTADQCYSSCPNTSDLTWRTCANESRPLIDTMTTTRQSKRKLCAYSMGYNVYV